MPALSLVALRVISMIEGLSYLYLLYHAIYSKLILGIEDAIKDPGMVHGVLFCVFCVVLFFAMQVHHWKLKIPMLIFLASLLPFAPIWVEIWLKKQQDKLR